MPKPIRRVVTGHDAAGRSVFVMDGPAPHVYCRSPGSAIVTELWETRAMPADNRGNAEVTDHAFRLAPPKNGSVFRIIDIPPTPPEIETLDNDYLHKQIGDHAPRKGLPPRHPLMHRTLTIDYAIIMQGEIDMLLDDSEIHLKAGDVLIQQGTNHAWVNRGTEPCRIAFILIDSKEP